MKFVFPGHIGIVKDATEATARVELHASCKIISVDRTRLSNIAYVSSTHLSLFISILGLIRHIYWTLASGHINIKGQFHYE